MQSQSEIPWNFSKIWLINSQIDILKILCIINGNIFLIKCKYYVFWHCDKLSFPISRISICLLFHIHYSNTLNIHLSINLNAWLRLIKVRNFPRFLILLLIFRILGGHRPLFQSTEKALQSWNSWIIHLEHIGNIDAKSYILYIPRAILLSFLFCILIWNSLWPNIYLITFQWKWYPWSWGSVRTILFILCCIGLPSPEL